METRPALELDVDPINIKKASHIFRAINHNLRQQLLFLLHLNEKMTVTELYINLRLEQSVASQHLAILRKAGLVSTNRDGKCIYYSVNYGQLRHLRSISSQLLDPMPSPGKETASPKVEVMA